MLQRGEPGPGFFTGMSFPAARPAPWRCGRGCLLQAREREVPGPRAERHLHRRLSGAAARSRSRRRLPLGNNPWSPTPPRPHCAPSPPPPRSSP